VERPLLREGSAARRKLKRDSAPYVKRNVYPGPTDRPRACSYQDLALQEERRS
jgi:hypothetical protein